MPLQLTHQHNILCVGNSWCETIQLSSLNSRSHSPSSCALRLKTSVAHDGLNCPQAQGVTESDDSTSRVDWFMRCMMTSGGCHTKLIAGASEIYILPNQVQQICQLPAAAAAILLPELGKKENRIIINYSSDSHFDTVEIRNQT